MAKHHCDKCADTSEIMQDPDWLQDNIKSGYKWHVMARHIHSGHIRILASFETESRARDYADNGKLNGRSHEHYCVIYQD